MNEEDKKSKEKVDGLFSKDNIKVNKIHNVEDQIISVLYSRGKISHRYNLGYSDRCLVKDLMFIYNKKNG